jgi:AhpD family alkylhydroperoxidase
VPARVPRGALRLHDLFDYGYPEIAEIVGRSEDARAARTLLANPHELSHLGGSATSRRPSARSDRTPIRRSIHRTRRTTQEEDHDPGPNAGLREATLALVPLRASQINGCSVCVDIHTRELEPLGESPERIHLVAAWRERRTSATPSAQHWP